MALPKLLQKLFQNGGAGDKLNPEIVPEIKKLMLGDHVLELQEDGSLKLDGNLVITSAGGQIDGQVVFGAGNPIAGARNDLNMLIAGGTGWDGGAHIILNGKDATNRVKGAVELVASDGVNEGRLDAWPNGLLRWNGADVEHVHSAGGNWIRYASGFQFCWGTCIADGSYGATSFPVPFYGVPIVLAGSTGQLNPNAGSWKSGGVSSTGFSAIIVRWVNNTITGVNTDGSGCYVAFGRWK